jgi:Zn-dependent protease
MADPHPPGDGTAPPPGAGRPPAGVPALPPADPGLPATFRGSFRLCRLAGTDVFVHWSWFVAAYFLIRDRPVAYSALWWDVIEYVLGFGLVLAHGFGHVLACRQAGGAADRVLLWPLGGLAFVAPPPRPLANLWTTAAGPLVNLVLAPVLFGAAYLTAPGPDELPTDPHRLAFALSWFNLVMLVFNLLPVFPLDGGRLLHAALWPLLGRAGGLAVAAGIGLLAAGALVAWSIAVAEWWMLAVGVFMVLGALGGLGHASMLARLKDAPRRTDVACPSCRTAPPAGPYWRCLRCVTLFDLFDPTDCPKGGRHTTDVSCLDCGRHVPPGGWVPVPGATPTAE